MEQSGTQIERQQRQYQRLENQIRQSSGQISGTLRTLATSFATYFSVREIVRFSDAFTEFQNRLRVAGLEGSQLADVQERLYRTAQQYGVELGTLGTLYSRVSQAAGELGVSQDEILSLTESVSAAVRVQGGSAEQASGALIQLSQALGAGTVRAEEFNSLMEGLFPLVQAAARGSDEFGGSVSRLRAAILEGEVSSREFFDAIQAGSEQLRTDANESVLTISQSFTVLGNAFTKYIGEAGEASGAAQALAAAIKALADNLDIIIPALAVIATGLGVGFVSNAVRAAAAAGGLRAALLGAFGGPVGLAITAVAVALAGFAANSIQAAQDAAALEQSVDATTAALEDLEERARQAGAGTDTLGNATDTAADKMRNAQGAVSRLVDLYNDLTTAAQRAAIAQAQERIQSASERNQRLRDLQRTSLPSGVGPFGRISLSNVSAISERIEQNNSEIERNSGYIEQVLANPRLFSDTPTPTGGASASDGSGRASRSRASGPSAEDLLQRFYSQRDGLAAQQISAEQRIAATTEERAELELRLTERRHAAVQREIDHNDQLTAAQKVELSTINDNIRLAEQEAIAVQRQEEEAQAALEIASARREGQEEILRIESGMAETAAERRRAELRILDLQEQEQRERLQILANSRDVATATAARARLENLSATSSARRAEIAYRNRSPGQRYLDELTMSAEESAEALEEVQIRGLQSIEDGLLDLLPSFDIVGGAFGKLIDGMITDLLRFVIQQNIIRPLAENLFGGSGGGGGGGFLSSLSSFAGLFGGGGGGSFSGFTNSSLINSIRLPGRASGGPVSAGQSYIVGEHGREVLTMGQSGFITPNHALGGQAGVAKVQLMLTDDLDARIVNRSAGVAVEVVRQSTPGIVDASANETFRRADRATL
tara:strand:- start:3501 stop:6182 length:2682 start_codon:yes stop_codon:yes gene_type:complete